MSKKKIEQSVRHRATELIKEKGYISPVDLLVKMERLTSKQVEDWRFKRIPYLERVTVGNLAKLNHTMKALKKFANEQNLKPSITTYKSWGKGPKKLLRFSKTGNPYMEELYSTHYVRVKSKRKSEAEKKDE
ncbi:hypothetical protein CIL05_05060 [Virgibacillus profundi]|uniref:Uncharacterized protein n=1 Tax=Virgibacillus profundi TaxID=2024555 RepID=A0A2A2IGM8_9BACI|nr:hypothetical protein [Virgibacillus profundi]PAV30476.1 hypothetical protein CIL05_05060 [Virgibacillus profundi]PXY54648.1 hypothetical protein CIT14_05145 [Virgibacillus profundi]